MIASLQLLRKCTRPFGDDIGKMEDMEERRRGRGLANAMTMALGTVNQASIAPMAAVEFGFQFWLDTTPKERRIRFGKQAEAF